MKRFADLHLCPDLRHRKQTLEMLDKASELAYCLVGIPLPPRANQDTVSFLRKSCSDRSLDFAKRIDLTPRSTRQLLNSLRQIRRRFEIVSVNCSSKSVARQAAKDHRVDLLVFPSIDPHKRFFDVAEAELACQGVASLEIAIAPLLRYSGHLRVQLLSCLRKEVTIARKFRIPVAISSSATDTLGLREPNSLVGLTALFGMDKTSAQNAVSVTPLTIVERNREKLKSSYVARGVKLVRRGSTRRK